MENKWIKFGLPYGPIYSENKSFCEMGLNKPGTLIKMKGKKIYLIGDVNPLGGVCDDCMNFDRKDIVKEYMVMEIPT